MEKILQPFRSNATLTSSSEARHDQAMTTDKHSPHSLGISVHSIPLWKNSIRIKILLRTLCGQQQGNVNENTILMYSGNAIIRNITELLALQQ
jgi:hypothetical protein